MKNLFYLIFLTILSSGIYSCKKEDTTAQKGTSLPPSASANNNDAKTKALIVGKWIIRADTLVETVDGNQKQFVVFRVPADGSWYETFLPTVPGIEKPARKNQQKLITLKTT